MRAMKRYLFKEEAMIRGQKADYSPSVFKVDGRGLIYYLLCGSPRYVDVEWRGEA